MYRGVQHPNSSLSTPSFVFETSAIFHFGLLKHPKNGPKKNRTHRHAAQPVACDIVRHRAEPVWDRRTWPRNQDRKNLLCTLDHYWTKLAHPTTADDDDDETKPSGSHNDIFIISLNAKIPKNMLIYAEIIIVCYTGFISEIKKEVRWSVVVRWLATTALMLEYQESSTNKRSVK